MIDFKGIFRQLPTSLLRTLNSYRSFFTQKFRVKLSVMTYKTVASNPYCWLNSFTLSYQLWFGSCACNKGIAIQSNMALASELQEHCCKDTFCQSLSFLSANVFATHCHLVSTQIICVPLCLSSFSQSVFVSRYKKYKEVLKVYWQAALSTNEWNRVFGVLFLF